jgi:hypothetical protein
MKRRSFLKSSGAAAMSMVRFTPSLALPARIALYDSALAQGRALAHHAARAGITTFSLRDDIDIGMLWHLRLAAQQAHTVALCALRASDRFVLERLATRQRFIVIDTTTISDPD